jgi:hypothetical protein
MALRESAPRLSRLAPEGVVFDVTTARCMKWE